MEITKDFIEKITEFGKSLAEEVVYIQKNDRGAVFKGDMSPLTKADIHSNDRIKNFLLENTPVSNIISEEIKTNSFQERCQWDYYWVIDPIDGTKEFVSGGDDFCINIALCHDNTPVFGYVICPKHHDHYYAIRDRGAYKNGYRIYSSNSYFLRDPVLNVVASKSHMNDQTAAYIEELENKYNVKLLNYGSSLKFCMIADGTAHVYPRFGPTMEWDTCAPQIIVEESGGSVYNTDTNQPLVYNKEDLLNPYFIVASPTYNRLQ